MGQFGAFWRANSCRDSCHCRAPALATYNCAATRPEAVHARRSSARELSTDADGSHALWLLLHRVTESIPTCLMFYLSTCPRLFLACAWSFDIYIFHFNSLLLYYQASAFQSGKMSMSCAKVQRTRGGLWIGEQGHDAWRVTGRLFLVRALSLTVMQLVRLHSESCDVYIRPRWHAQRCDQSCSRLEGSCR